MTGRTNQETEYDSQQDDELLTQLRQAVELSDPPPEDLADRARRAFSWDAAFHVLVEQELSNDAAPALRRNDASTRSLSYQLPTTSLALTIDQAGDGSCNITGTVSPPAAAVELVEPNGDTMDVDIDRKGRFTATTWASAAVVQLTLADGDLVRTPVITLDEADGSDFTDSDLKDLTD